MKDNQGWDLVIRPKDRMLAIDWKEMWRYRDLFILFVRRDISTRYKQTVLGPIWFVISPVLGMVVMVVVFGGIAGISTDGVPPALFYLLGPAVWSYFSACLSGASNSFVSNSDIFGKVYFPRMIMPLVSVTANLLNFAVNLLVFFVLYIWYVATGTHLSPNWTALFCPFYILVTALMAMGLGMMVSSVSTKYRDVQMLFTYITGLWMYVTPVIYPMSMVSNPKLHLMMLLNPMTPVMEATRYSLLGAGEFSLVWLGYSMGVTVLLLLAGTALFNRTQKSFMDTV